MILYSQEGTTQGDPLGMPMYALAIVPLINNLQAPVNQIMYSDDAPAPGKINNLRSWWNKVASSGAYASKTWLVVKEGFML